jgi:hypothetical protein
MGDKKYLILGKTSGNEWLPISLLYPDLLDFPASYETLELAQRAKGRLKQLTKNHPSLGKKLPYRIEALEF